MKSVCFASFVALTLTQAGCFGPIAPQQAQTDSGFVGGPVDYRTQTALVSVQGNAGVKSMLRALADRLPGEQERSLLRSHAEGASFGSGFLVVRKGPAGDKPFLVTNRHVIESAQEVEVTFGDGVSFAHCPVVLSSDRFDLGVVALPDSVLRVHPYGFVPSTAVLTERETVVAAGFPGLAGKPSFQTTEGKISNARLTLPGDGGEYLQHTAAIDPGSSGGPLTNEAGALVGVNTAIIRSRQAMNLAVPAAAVTAAVAEAYDLERQSKDERWMRESLTHACATLQAELTGPVSAGSVQNVSKLVSNAIVGSKGLEAWAIEAHFDAVGMTQALLDDPTTAFKYSVMNFLHRTINGRGGVSSSTCGNIHPGDVARVAQVGQPIRMTIPTSASPTMTSWTFEQGHWRIADADFPEIRFSNEVEAPKKSNGKVQSKTSKKSQPAVPKNHIVVAR